jgi:hypothetical protein
VTALDRANRLVGRLRWLRLTIVLATYLPAMAITWASDLRHALTYHDWESAPAVWRACMRWVRNPAGEQPQPRPEGAPVSDRWTGGDR